MGQKCHFAACVLPFSSQTASGFEGLLEIEARLFFVSTIANRIRLAVPAGGDTGDSSAGSQAGPCTDPRRDSFVLQLLQLLPQLAFPASPRDSTAPSVDITEAEALTLFLLAAIARAISWLSNRIVPQHPEMFSPLFSLLFSQGLQFVASLPVSILVYLSHVICIPSCRLVYVHIVHMKRSCLSAHAHLYFISFYFLSVNFHVSSAYLCCRASLFLRNVKSLSLP